MNDPVILVLYVVIAVALVLLIFRSKKPGQGKVEVRVAEAIRSQARPLIPPPVPSAALGLFALGDSPLQITPARPIPQQRDGKPVDWFQAEYADALWAQQRQMLLRLESELEMAQQADLSEHFAIAGPANQPADLLTQNLQHAEKALKLMGETFQLGEIRQLWVGRALILMLSNRKLFDHVVWLTGAGVEQSMAGAFIQTANNVAMIGVYATRLMDCRRIIADQVTRLVLRTAANPQVKIPRWFEEGLANSFERKIAGPPASAVNPAPAGPKAPPVVISVDDLLSPVAWDQARNEVSRLEKMQLVAGQAVEALLKNRRQALAGLFARENQGPGAGGAWDNLLGTSEVNFLRGFLSAVGK